MTRFRFIPLALALTAASALVACNTAPSMPMGTASASDMAMPDHMAKMDAHMKTMQSMHDKMMAAKTPEERKALMGEHMKAMQDGMTMMGKMGSGGAMSGMDAGTKKGGMSMDMMAHHDMMEKRMEMMTSMMQMMMDRMPTPAAP